MKTHVRAAWALTGLCLLMMAGAASAHTGEDTSGFVSGFTHPIFGWDHVVAMVAVGLWGAFLGRTAIWVLPITFPIVMAFGGALGISGFQLPLVETGIAASGLVLGLMVALAVRLPIGIAMAMVGIFAIFHGFAHGQELPETSNPLGYTVGFVVGTSLLHLAGIGLGFLTKVPFGSIAVRALGGAIALVGAAFLAGVA